MKRYRSGKREREEKEVEKKKKKKNVRKKERKIVIGYVIALKYYRSSRRS